MELSVAKRFGLHRKVHCRPLSVASMVMEKHGQMVVPAVLSRDYARSVMVVGIGKGRLPGCTVVLVAPEGNVPVGMELPVREVRHKAKDGLHKGLVLKAFHHSMPAEFGSSLGFAECELQGGKHGYNLQNGGLKFGERCHLQVPLLLLSLAVE